MKHLEHSVDWYIQNEYEGCHAATNINGQEILLEEAILGIRNNSIFLIIHLNGNTLDNQEHNLHVLNLLEDKN